MIVKLRGAVNNATVGAGTPLGITVSYGVALWLLWAAAGAMLRCSLVVVQLRRRATCARLYADLDDCANVSSSSRRCRSCSRAALAATRTATTRRRTRSRTLAAAPRSAGRARTARRARSATRSTRPRRAARSATERSISSGLDRRRSVVPQSLMPCPSLSRLYKSVNY